MEKIVKTSLITVGITAAFAAFLVYINQEEGEPNDNSSSGGSNSSSGDEYSSSNSHEMSTDSTNEDDEGTVSSPRTMRDYLKILKYDENTDYYIMKKLESTQILLTISAYSESFPLLEELDVINIVLENMNYILSLDITSPNQDSLLIKLGLFLGNLLASKNSQKKVVDSHFVPTLLSLVNDKVELRADFSLLCLQNLSLNIEGAEEIIVSQGLPSLLKLLNNSTKPNTLKKQALYTILNISLITRVKNMISNNQDLIDTLGRIDSGSYLELSNLTSRILTLLFQNDDEE